MKPENDNSLRDDSAAMLDENVSRLLKAASNSAAPSRRFSESLIGGALSELEDVRVERKGETHRAAGSDWFEKSLGWAAMVAAACSAGVAVMASILLKTAFVFQSVVASTMVFNWLTYLGEYMR
jgi:hypothetical protein